MSLRKKYVNSSLINKTCSKCGNSYPRDEEHFYKNKSSSNKSLYDSWCIICRNKSSQKWKNKNKGKTLKTSLKYRQSEHGFFNEMFNSLKKSEYYIESEFPDQESFMKHWYKQKEKFGMTCPATGIEMTMKKGDGLKHKNFTNISKDRLLPWQGYTKQNTIFVAWKFNNDKKAITPKDAIAYLRLVKERFNTTDIE